MIFSFLFFFCFFFFDKHIFYIFQLSTSAAQARCRPKKTFRMQATRKLH